MRETTSHIELTAGNVADYVSHHPVSSADLPAHIHRVHAAFAKVVNGDRTVGIETRRRATHLAGLDHRVGVGRNIERRVMVIATMSGIGITPRCAPSEYDVASSRSTAEDNPWTAPDARRWRDPRTFFASTIAD